MMAALRRFVLRCYNFVAPGRSEAALQREIGAHLEMLEERFLENGLAPEHAAAAARRELGVDRTVSLHRDARSFLWLEDLRLDLRHAMRLLGRSPQFSALAVLTLAVGVGSVTAIYSVVHNVLLDPLPYPGADRFVNLGVQSPAGGSRYGLTAAEFLAYRDRASAFEGVVATRGESALLQVRDRAEPIRSVWVSANFFDFMGLPPLLGRALSPADSRPGAAPVAVLRHRAWVNLFGGDTGVLGQTVILNGETRTIVGVMPPRFTWHAADLWVPLPADLTAVPPAWRVAFQARLRPGTTPETAEVQVSTIAAARAREHPHDYPDGFRIRVPYVIDSVVGDFKEVLLTLLGAVALLMLIACCNVANMLLARATTREREMTIRAAIGAGRGRLVRQLLVESALLSGAGAAAGIALAYGTLQVLVPLLPEGPLPGEIEIVLNLPVLLTSLATAVVSGLLFGLAPAVFGARVDLVGGLKSGARGTREARRTARSALVVAEVSLAVVLVLSSTLLLRTFLALSTQELGFNPENILSVRPAFPPGAYDEPDERRRFYQQWMARIAALPGVQQVAAVSGPPPFSGYEAEVEVAGRAQTDRSMTQVQRCTDGYFATIGVPLIRGQGLAEDRLEHPRAVAVVNEAFVKMYLAGIEPVGGVIRLTLPPGPGQPAKAETYEIIGVAADVRNRGIREAPAPEVYVPGFPAGATPAVLVRTAIGTAAVTSAVRLELGQMDRLVGLRETTLTDLLSRNFYAQPRFSLIVLAAFSIAGMLLVAVGVYSVLAYTVSQQTREIAVRLALGARRSTICSMVLRWAGTLVAVGLAVGLAMAVATSRLLADQLWRTSTHDPGAIAVTVVLVSVLAVVACLVPIRRAMGVEPMAALRQD